MATATQRPTVIRIRTGRVIRLPAAICRPVPVRPAAVPPSAPDYRRRLIRTSQRQDRTPFCTSIRPLPAYRPRRPPLRLNRSTRGRWTNLVSNLDSSIHAETACINHGDIEIGTGVTFQINCYSSQSMGSGFVSPV